MKINENVLQNQEKVIFSLRELYLNNGYLPYRMSKFEEYDLYAGNKDFLVSDNVITFTDTDGKLMALKPDVTLSIIKNGIDAPEKTQKVFYNENVYRVSKSTDSFKEIMQVGVECFGKVGNEEICQVVKLAAESLLRLSDGAVLAVSDLSVISQLIEQLRLDNECRRALYQAINEKNIYEIQRLCRGAKDSEAVSLLMELLQIHGKAADVLPQIRMLLSCTNSNLCTILESLIKAGDADCLVVDFSIINDVNYYNGLVFKGFLPDVPRDVLSGGQYDALMRRMGKKSSAIGFAVYTDMLDRMDFASQDSARSDSGFINIALPKGRLGEKVYAMFARAGFECPSILEPNRKLIFENPEKGVRYFWVKPSDVPIYVERGAADIGVAGKDILLEYEPDVYELLDLKKGKCRMAVAAPNGYEYDPSRTLVVATKFSNIAKKYYRSLGRDIDIIHLNGSIEIAPILKLSDVIVDIVETGTTLRENDLSVLEEIVPISARLIANKATAKFKFDKIQEIAANLFRVVEEDA